ncbi:uncharacterized protein LOC100827005 isoform X2 [Brachypodium distachyon]|uniref:uncharacterized protein LOC100827005 isoform X2 n=1 Tax=Brachypodium distachyon TaxID=15368 RepID=UPI000D0CC633|nr:uncharacterized protein LOC100827005 isoform X2 [Brachypodium distachyon]|eukprot:XP_024311076.1 uncharacterized protein LOC100827005 isoform X2 [Brachypodium distachyon]
MSVGSYDRGTSSSGIYLNKINAKSFLRPCTLWPRAVYPVPRSPLSLFFPELLSLSLSCCSPRAPVETSSSSPRAPLLPLLFCSSPRPPAHPVPHPIPGLDLERQRRRGWSARRRAPKSSSAAGLVRSSVRPRAAGSTARRRWCPSFLVSPPLPPPPALRARTPLPGHGLLVGAATVEAGGLVSTRRSAGSPSSRREQQAPGLHRRGATPEAAAVASFFVCVPLCLSCFFKEKILEIVCVLLCLSCFFKEKILEIGVGAGHGLHFSVERCAPAPGISSTDYSESLEGGQAPE